jgi:WXG100 family type VII secretion target
MTSPLVYNFDGIGSIAGSINAFVADMDETLSNVDSTFRNLLADGWAGSGAQAFEGCSHRWHTSAQQMAQTLQHLSQKVGNAAANMQQADQAAAARF